jgi:hypothetical protein
MVNDDFQYSYVSDNYESLNFLNERVNKGLDLSQEIVNSSNLARNESIVLFYCDTQESVGEFGTGYRKFNL